MVLSLVDELGVRSDRDVVEEEPFAYLPDVDPSLHTLEGRESADRIVAVETEVAREVVPSAERDADERHVALECQLGDGRQRSVAPGDAQRGRARPRERRRIVAGAEDSGFDSSAPCFVFELFDIRASPARMRIDQE
jgi:hypothetical protein